MIFGPLNQSLVDVDGCGKIAMEGHNLWVYEIKKEEYPHCMIVSDMLGNGKHVASFDMSALHDEL